MITRPELVEVLDSKIYVNNANKSFESPRTYLEPVLEDMLNYGVSENDIVVQVEKPVVNRNEDGTLNRSFPRIKVEAKLHESNQVGGNIVGFITALDRNQFVAYGGSRVFACTNLCVFSDEEVYNVKGDFQNAQNKVKEYITGSEKRLARFAQFYNEMTERTLSMEEYQKLITHLEYFARSKKGLSKSIVSTGLDFIISPQSVYHFSIDSSRNSLWNLYNAFTQVITDKNTNSTNPTYLVDAPNATKALTKAFMEFDN